MIAQLQALRELQSIDNQLTEAKRAQAQLDVQLAELRAGLELLNQDLLRREVELDETRLLKEEHEAALKAQEEAINRSKGKMSGVRKNQEYLALQRELDNARKAVSIKEEELVKIIEVEDATRNALSERRNKLEDLKKSVKAFEENYGGRTAGLTGRVSDLDATRQELVSRLPAKLMRQYERIRDARNGMAVAEVKDELCLGCHMGIQPQLYNELQRGDQIVMCPSCNRILYYAGHEQKGEQERPPQA